MVRLLTEPVSDGLYCRHIVLLILSTIIIHSGQQNHQDNNEGEQSDGDHSTCDCHGMFSSGEPIDDGIVPEVVDGG